VGVLTQCCQGHDSQEPKQRNSLGRLRRGLGERAHLGWAQYLLGEVAAPVGPANVGTQQLVFVSEQAAQKQLAAHIPASIGFAGIDRRG
jgi:hypothetical protein